MLHPWDGLIHWFEAALSGMVDPLLIGIALALTTFLLEDVAIAAGVALATQGTITWGLSLSAVGGGIAIGDLGLYLLGFGAARVPWLKKRYLNEKAFWAKDQLVSRLPSAILIARVVPGLRFITYTACGFLQVPLLPFCIWVLFAVTLWTLGLYGLSILIGERLTNTFGLPAPLAVAIPILVIALALPLILKGWKHFKSSTR